jgi:hypothetical protein
MTDELTFASDDELLSAYLDGVLPAGKHAEFERRLQQDRELARRLDRLARVNAVVRDAYVSDVDEPLPQSILDLLGDTERPAGPRADIVDLAVRRGADVPQSFTWPAALAASVTLAIGVGLGYLVSSGGTDAELAWLASAGVVEAGTPLHAALETGTSGSIHAIGDALSARPVLSFIATDSEYCRQLELGGRARSADALACRRNGAWQLEALSFLPGQPGAGQQGGVFRPAGATSSAIDAAIDERIVGDALDDASERELIETGWVAR